MRGLSGLSGLSGVSSRTVDRAMTSADRKVTVSKTVQDAILKNIIGQYNQDDDNDETSGDETVEHAVSKITGNKELDQEETEFQNRLENMKKKISNEVKLGKHGDVKLEEKKHNNPEKVKENNLEDEVRSLRNELKELKEHIKNKNSASASSSSSEDESDEDESDGGESEEEKPISVLDVFKTTILKKSKTTKSTYLCKDSSSPSHKKSQLIESKTCKILKERIQMRNKRKML